MVAADDRVEPGRSVEDGGHLRPDDRRQPGVGEVLAEGAEGRRRHDGVADQVGAEDHDLHGCDVLSGHSLDGGALLGPVLSAFRLTSFRVGDQRSEQSLQGREDRP